MVPPAALLRQVGTRGWLYSLWRCTACGQDVLMPSLVVRVSKRED